MPDGGVNQNFWRWCWWFNACFSLSLFTETKFEKYIFLDLSDWGHQGFICFLKFHNVFAQKPLLYFISRHMSINSCWWNVSASALERVLFSFPAWNGICRDFLKVEIQKNLQIKAKIFTFGNYIVSIYLGLSWAWIL